MPKFTKTGYELGSSESPAIVLMATPYETNQDVLTRHRDKRNNVERIDTFRQRNPEALLRGNCLEAGVADWGKEKLEIQNPNSTITMYEPQSSFQNIPEKMGASIDRIIEISEVPVELEDGNGETFSFIGSGIAEIKTDFYHRGVLKPEWLIQVHHQMICSGLTWGIVFCMDQKGSMNFYPINKNEKLCSVIAEKIREFWHLMETDADYPVIAKQSEDYVDVEEMLKTSNQDFEQLCYDYTSASGEARKWTKTKDEIKLAISDVMDTLGVTHAKFQNYEIVSETKIKEKKKMVNTGETYESHSFTLKEKN